MFLYLFEVFYRKEFKICVYVSLSKTGAHQIPVIPEINLYVTLNEFDLQYPTKLLTKYAHVLVEKTNFDLSRVENKLCLMIHYIILCLIYSLMDNICY